MDTSSTQSRYHASKHVSPDHTRPQPPHAHTRTHTSPHILFRTRTRSHACRSRPRAHTRTHAAHVAHKTLVFWCPLNPLSPAHRCPRTRPRTCSVLFLPVRVFCTPVALGLLKVCGWYARFSCALAVFAGGLCAHTPRLPRGVALFHPRLAACGTLGRSLTRRMVASTPQVRCPCPQLVLGDYFVFFLVFLGRLEGAHRAGGFIRVSSWW
jgi:hypothetical protein